MRNLEMVIQYDGGRYEGWQRLGGGKAGRTIQGVLEEALSGITGAPVEVIGSGRTGVHALGQVIYTGRSLLRETSASNGPSSRFDGPDGQGRSQVPRPVPCPCQTTPIAWIPGRFMMSS